VLTVLNCAFLMAHLLLRVLACSAPISMYLSGNFIFQHRFNYAKEYCFCFCFFFVFCFLMKHRYAQHNSTCWLLIQLLHALKPMKHAKHTRRLTMIFSSITECKQKANKLPFHLWCVILFYILFWLLTTKKKQEPDGGAIKHLYNFLAVQKTKTGKPLSVFWDVKCLNDGQNWEKGFIHGLQHSQVIVPLVSHSVCILFLVSHLFHKYTFLTLVFTQALYGIALNASQKQDNVLIEYPISLFFCFFFFNSNHI
jgi:hypothetical protein